MPKLKNLVACLCLFLFSLNSFAQTGTDLVLVTLPDGKQVSVPRQSLLEALNKTDPTQVQVGKISFKILKEYNDGTAEVGDFSISYADKKHDLLPPSVQYQEQADIICNLAKYRRALHVKLKKGLYSRYGAMVDAQGLVSGIAYRHYFGVGYPIEMIVCQ